MLDQVKQVSLKLEVAGESELMVFLTDSGTVNRYGGGEDSDQATLCMGRSEESLLRFWLESMDESLLEMAGRYTMPDAEKGDSCYLELALEGEDLNTGFAFTYGSEGVGPPEEMLQIANSLVAVTDPWYEEQMSRKRQR